MCSAGIGSSYEISYNAKRNRYKGKDTKETYKMENGVELPLPKYYHDKLYTEDERENLWIVKQKTPHQYSSKLQKYHDPNIVTGKQIGRASCRERVSSPV